MAVDAGAGVPAAVGLQAVIDGDEDFVLPLVTVEVGGDIDGERGIAVAVLTDFLAVDEDLSPLIDAFEMELHKFAGRGLEGLAVLAGAALEPAASGAGGACGGVGGVVDIPVVGQTDTLGLSVTGKLPAVVEQPGGLGLEADIKTHTD